jgi:glutaminyl-tRNA synthetase
VEEDDFRLEPDKKWFRLAPGATVRLKSAYIVTCTGYDLGPDGRVTEIRATYLPESKSGSDTSGLKVKGTLHWVSASHAFDAEVRLYDRLFADPEPDGHEGRDFLEFLNPESLTVLSGCKLEPALAEALPGQGYQFTRLGYFTPDARHSRPHAPVFNRAVTLKDGWKG